MAWRSLELIHHIKETQSGRFQSAKRASFYIYFSPSTSSHSSLPGNIPQGHGRESVSQTQIQLPVDDSQDAAAIGGRGFWLASSFFLLYPLTLPLLGALPNLLCPPDSTPLLPSLNLALTFIPLSLPCYSGLPPTSARPPPENRDYSLGSRSPKR